MGDNEINNVILKRECDFEELYETYKFLILKYAKKVKPYFREDIQQELLMGLYRAFNKFVEVKYSVAEGFFSDENYAKLDEQLSESELIQSPKYLSGFISKYGKTLLVEAFTSTEKRDEFIMKYSAFCNRNQFSNYLQTTFKNIIIDYNKKFWVNLNNQTISLNALISENVELLETIDDKSANAQPIRFRHDLSDSDWDFAIKFIDKSRIKSEKEVAKELGISQQAVNRKKLLMRKRYRNSQNY